VSIGPGSIRSSIVLFNKVFNSSPGTRHGLDRGEALVGGVIRVRRLVEEVRLV
jgi:hypothetical protein